MMEMKMILKKYSIEIEGLAPIIFDRFIDHSKEPRPPEQKFYLDVGNVVVLPSANIENFLKDVARKTEGRKHKDYLSVIDAFVVVDPKLVPFIDKKKIVFDNFDEDSKFYINKDVPRTKMSGGTMIKQPTLGRPALRLPWRLAFEVSIFENNYVRAQKLANWFEWGGINVGLGNYRPKHGRFMVTKFEEIK